jgi:Helicase conserved C-terminal domain
MAGLYRVSGLAKVAGVWKYVRQALNQSGTRKLILFAHHREVLDALQQRLRADRVQFVRIDGETPSKRRAELCARFQSPQAVACRVALLSITAAGTGITLHAASLVVFAELYWTPGILNQAEDRAHRIGQRQDVDVHYLLARSTIDDLIWPIITSKLRVVGQALDGQSGSLAADVVDPNVCLIDSLLASARSSSSSSPSFSSSSSSSSSSCSSRSSSPGLRGEPMDVLDEHSQPFDTPALAEGDHDHILDALPGSDDSPPLRSTHTITLSSSASAASSWRLATSTSTPSSKRPRASSAHSEDAPPTVVVRRRRHSPPPMYSSSASASSATSSIRRTPLSSRTIASPPTPTPTHTPTTSPSPSLSSTTAPASAAYSLDSARFSSQLPSPCLSLLDEHQDASPLDLEPPGFGTLERKLDACLDVHAIEEIDDLDDVDEVDEQRDHRHRSELSELLSDAKEIHDVQEEQEQEQEQGSVRRRNSLTVLSKRKSGVPQFVSQLRFRRTS